MNNQYIYFKHKHFRAVHPALFVVFLLTVLICGCKGGSGGGAQSAPDSSLAPEEYAAALRPFKAGKKYGYRDSNGNIIIEPRFRQARRFKEGLAAVNDGKWLKDRWGFIDSRGNFVIPAAYEYAQDFEDGRTVVTQRDVKWLIVMESPSRFVLLPADSASADTLAFRKFPGPLPGMEFVQLPGGIFKMGSDSGVKNEAPEHFVGVPPFQIMISEVTQAQWKAVMGSRPSYFKGDDRPLEMMTMIEIQRFLIRLNRRDPGKKYRLPSEAEWEYACRAGSDGDYCFGDDAKNLPDYAWMSANAVSTMPVKGKKPNDWGLFDMHGNVWELCADHYRPDYEGAPADGEALIDTSAGFSLTVRGGSWNLPAGACRSAARVPCWKYGAWNTTGFRVVRRGE